MSIPATAHLPAAPSGAAGRAPGSGCAMRGARVKERGISLIEVMAGVTLLIVAILTHASTTVGEHRLTVDERVRSEALHIAEQVVQRLRADEDWTSLYARLRARLDGAAGPSADTVRLDDGRLAHAPETYFPNFSLTEPMRNCHLLLEVPSAVLDSDPTGLRRLREDVAAPRFGLPADLNGDGVVDGEARDDDYAVLPVRLILQWQPAGEATRELELLCWLRGDR